MKNMRKKIFLGGLILICIPLLIYIWHLTNYLFLSFEYALKVSWGISLEPSKKVECLVSSDGIDGNFLYIAYYDSDKMSKMTNLPNFSVLNENNMVEIQEFLFDFYNLLSTDDKNKFDQYFDADELIVINRPYIFTSQKHDYRNKILLLFDFDSNKIYILTTTA